MDQAASAKSTPKKNAPQKNDATFLAACETAGTNVTKSRAELLDLLRDSKCPTIAGETTKAMRERVAALLWVLKFWRHENLHKELSDEQLDTLRTVYGDSIRQVDRSKLVSAISAYYTLVVETPENSDDEPEPEKESDDDIPTIVPSALNGSPFGLVRPDAGKTSSKPSPAPPAKATTCATPSKANSVNSRADWAWPRANRLAMRVTSTFTPEDVRQLNALSKCADLFGADDDGEGRDLFHLNTAVWSDQVPFLAPSSGRFSALEAGKQLLRASFFFDPTGVDHVSRSRALLDRTERVALADALRRQAIPGSQDAALFWATEHRVANYAATLFEERAHAAADLARQFGSKDIADRMLQQSLDLAGHLQQVRRWIADFVASADTIQSDLDARRQTATFWMPLLAPARFICRSSKTDREVNFALGTVADLHSSKRWHNDSDSSDDDVPTKRAAATPRRVKTTPPLDVTPRAAAIAPPPPPAPRAPAAGPVRQPPSADARPSAPTLCYPYTRGVLGLGLSQQTFGGTCKQPSCPSAQAGSAYLAHARAECPLRLTLATGAPPPGWDATGHMAPADWEGDASSGFPHGSRLTAAARARWPAYARAHNLIRSHFAEPASPFLDRPPQGGGAQ